jgi:hypothetical protein
MPLPHKSLRFEWVLFESIKLPPAGLIQELQVLPTDLFNKFMSNERHEILTRDAAIFISRQHPLTVLKKGQNHLCICGIQTLSTITPLLKPHDVIPAMILPSTTSHEDLLELINTDTLLSLINYSTRKSEVSIFKAARTLPLPILKKLSPALSGTIERCAKVLGVSASTLYNSMRSKQ